MFKVGDKVFADIICVSSQSYLTEGKQYTTSESDSFTDFGIVDDEGDTLGCNLRGCAHLGEGNIWTIV